MQNQGIFSVLSDRWVHFDTILSMSIESEWFFTTNENGELVIIFWLINIGMPDVELGVNDIKRMGLEVVGRHDILPIPTEQWIRYEDIEFHSAVEKTEFEKNDHIIKWEL